MEFWGVRTIKWIRFLEFGLGTGVIFALMILLIALANALASASGPVVPGVSSCAEDMLVGVGRFDGGWVPRLEFPEVSRRVK